LSFYLDSDLQQAYRRLLRQKAAAHNKIYYNMADFMDEDDNVELSLFV